MWRKTGRDLGSFKNLFEQANLSFLRQNLICMKNKVIHSTSLNHFKQDSRQEMHRSFSMALRATDLTNIRTRAPFFRLILTQAGNGRTEGPGANRPSLLRVGEKNFDLRF